jgi:hypothetical protein
MASEAFIERVKEHALKIGFKDGMSTNDAIYIILADLYRLQDQINDIREHLKEIK